MTIGSPAFHEETITLPADMTAARIIQALASMGLRASTSPDGNIIRSSMGLNIWSWSEKLEIRRLAPTTALVRSECAMPLQMFDWGKNRTNVKKIVGVLHGTTQPR